MSKTTITRGNILAATIVQVPLPSTTISGTTIDVTLSVRTINKLKTIKEKTGKSVSEIIEDSVIKCSPN